MPNPYVNASPNPWARGYPGATNAPSGVVPAGYQPVVTSGVDATTAGWNPFPFTPTAANPQQNVGVFYGTPETGLTPFTGSLAQSQQFVTQAAGQPGTPFYPGQPQFGQPGPTSGNSILGAPGGATINYSQAGVNPYLSDPLLASYYGAESPYYQQPGGPDFYGDSDLFTAPTAAGALRP